MRINTLLTIAVFAYGSSDANSKTTTQSQIPANSMFFVRTRHLGSSDDLNGCRPAGLCELCPGGKRSGKTSCELTGRRQEFLCDVGGQETEDDDTNTEVKYLSCKRTTVDEEYLMFQFQAICVMVAFVAIRSVRREKMTSESLFDQRKRRAKQELFTPLTAAAYGVTSSSYDNGNPSSDNNSNKDNDDGIVRSRVSGSFEEESDTSRKVFDKV